MAFPLDEDVTAGDTGHIQAHEDVAAALNTLTGSTLPVASLAASFQPLDSDLTAIAALTTTAYGRGLLALANQAALETTLDGSFIRTGGAQGTMAVAGAWGALPALSLLTFAFTDGDLRLMPLNLPSCDIDRWGFEITSAAGTGGKSRIVVYKDVDGAGPAGGDLVFDSGQIAADGATGAKNATATVAHTGGRLWAGVVNQGGTPTATLRYVSSAPRQMLFNAQPTSQIGGPVYSVTCAGAAPATCPAGAYNQNSSVYVSWRFA